MKKALLFFIDLSILATVWLLFILSAVYLSVVGLYFPQVEIAGSIGIISTLLLAITYTIFWVRRFKKQRTK
jgi:hypothetical protein